MKPKEGTAMENSQCDKATAFDTLYTNNQIQMLKIILTYMDKKTQKSMAVYIKFLELTYTINLFKNNPYSTCCFSETESEFDISKMCTEILPYCTETQRSQINQMLSMFKTMEMYKEISKTMEFMKEFMPDLTEGSSAGSTLNNDTCDNPSGETHTSDGGNFDMMNMLMNMLSPEQKEMFQMLNN